MIIGLAKEFLAWRRRRKARRARKDGPSPTASTESELTAAELGTEEEKAPVVLEKEVEVDKPVSGALPGDAESRDEVPPTGRVLRSRRSTPGRP